MTDNIERAVINAERGSANVAIAFALIDIAKSLRELTDDPQ